MSAYFDGSLFVCLLGWLVGWLFVWKDPPPSLGLNLKEIVGLRFCSEVGWLLRVMKFRVVVEELNQSVS